MRERVFEGHVSKAKMLMQPRILTESQRALSETSRNHSGVGWAC